MTEPRPFRLIDASLLLLILAIAAGARSWYLSDCANGGSTSGPIRVQDPSPADDRDTPASNLKQSGSFSASGPLAEQPEPTSHVAPGYPWLVAMAGQLSDPERAVRWGQVALGALTAALYFLFARRAFGSTLVAALAGVFCALHPFWVIGAVELEDGVVTAFLLALAIWLGARAGQSGGPLTSLLYGLSLAGLALVRAALLPFAFVAVLWFLWRCRTLTRGWLYALLAFLGFANALVPWTLRNYQLNQEIVPIADTAWWHLWLGNSPDATGGPEKQEDAVGRLAHERGRTADEVRKTFGAVPQTQRYGPLAQDVADEVLRNPAGTINRRLTATVSFLLGERWLGKGEVWYLAGSTSDLPEWLGQSFAAILLGTLLAMLLLALVGWRWSYAWRLASGPAALAVVWLPLPYILSHAESLSGPRLPLDGILLTYAAVALVGVLPGVGTRLREGTALDSDVDYRERSRPLAA
jgi:4-amino-4-deoxy-L-arabinose transferase-like glycosyltransferase